MSTVMENLARSGVVAAALALGAGAGTAAPFQMVTDGPESVWTLDTASGELTWCKTRTPTGPKVLDVFGESAEPRPQTPRQSVTSCKVARGPETANPRYARIMRLFDGGYDGYGGFGGYWGGWGYNSSFLTSGMYADLYGGSSGTYTDIYKARSGTRDFYGYRID
jgi:hypothetical protein